LSVVASNSFLKISGSAYDNDLKLLIEAASTEVESFCDRQLISAAITDELHTGRGTRVLFPLQWPVTTLSSVSIWDGDAYTSESTAYVTILDEKGLYYPAIDQIDNATYSNWGDTVNGIKITYTAGYDTTNWDTDAITTSFGVPNDLEWAVAMIAALKWLEGRASEGRMGKSGINVGEQTILIERFKKDYSPQVNNILRRYSRKGF